MEIREEKHIEDLCRDGVIIATQEILVRDTVEERVGEIKRKSYGNWESDRKMLCQNEPEDIVSAVFSIWGNEATVE